MMRNERALLWIDVTARNKAGRYYGIRCNTLVEVPGPRSSVKQRLRKYKIGSDVYYALMVGGMYEETQFPSYMVSQ